MTHNWNDFSDADLGPQLPLTSGQQAQLVSGVLPSGESNFFDLEQDRQRYNGLGIDRLYDYEKEAGGSGVVATYPSETLELIDEQRESGIFHQQLIGNELTGSGSIFSSGYYIPSGFDVRFQQYIRPTVSPYEPARPDYAYRTMDSYIHHKVYLAIPTPYIEIKYISDFIADTGASGLNPYTTYVPNKNGYYNAEFKGSSFRPRRDDD